MPTTLVVDKAQQLAAAGHHAEVVEYLGARRRWLPLVILLAVVACQDAAAPLNEQNVAGPLFSVTGEPVRMLHQSPTAPPLETYQVSFWAHVNKASAVTVNYQPVAGQSQGQPFLLFYIRQHALEAGAGGAPLRSRDSVFITLTIDPVSFAVDFQPSGVLFSTKSPAFLGFWYENANPDLDGDGGVDATDQALTQRLAMWYRVRNGNGWTKLDSENDVTLPRVSTYLYHFSQYAVSW